jgi:hypothetical protein
MRADAQIRMSLNVFPDGALTREKGNIQTKKKSRTKSPRLIQLANSRGRLFTRVAI